MSSKEYSSGERTAGVTRNASQQGIAEYANDDGVDRPFFLQPGGRMALNKSMNAIQMIEKKASRGSRGRTLKQASLKSTYNISSYQFFNLTTKLITLIR